MSVKPGISAACFKTMNMYGNTLSPSQTTSIPYLGTTFEDESRIGQISLAATPFQPTGSACRQPSIRLPPKGRTYEWSEFCDENVEVKSPRGAMISIQDQETLALY